LAFLEGRILGARPPGNRPGYRLFSAAAVGWTTLLGSIPAGGTLLAINYWRLRRKWAAFAVFLVCFGVIVAAGTMYAILSEGDVDHGPAARQPAATFPRVPFGPWLGVLIALGMGGLANGLQGKSLRAHERQGGQMASPWAALGIGVTWLALCLALIVAGSLVEETERADRVFVQGYAAQEKGDLDKAIADYTEAIRIDPAYTHAHYNRGLAYCRKGQWDKAIADCTEAIRLDPRYAGSYHLRGHAYRMKGEPDKAQADFAKAKELLE
jgi:tetratricopeptide (TPR) repeat protein